MSNNDNNSKAASSLHQIVVFKLGNEEYALSIDQIKEVVITPVITQMPQSPAYVKGVANIRGNVIAILDLEEKFGIGKNQVHNSGSNNFTLVIESDELKVGILVKEVPNTLSISSSNIEDTVFSGDHQANQSYITGIVKLDKRLIIMIDIFKVISDQESNQIFKRQSSAQGMEV